MAPVVFLCCLTIIARWRSGATYQYAVDHGGHMYFHITVRDRRRASHFAHLMCIVHVFALTLESRLSVQILTFSLTFAVKLC